METGKDQPPCYEFVLFESDQEPIWNEESTINATYVIYLEGNEERYQQVIEQLTIIKPTKTIWILHNKGYKKCQKPNYITNSSKDIIDANIEIFKHAKEKGYEGSILVLEDDFLFDSRLQDSPKDTKEVIRFIKDYGDQDPLLYYLGVLPLLQTPIEWSHNMVLVSCGTHGVIFNRKFREMIMKVPLEEIDDWDFYMLRYLGYRYTYRIPLCYQLFPYTENSKNWGYHILLLKFLSSWFHYINIEWLQLDRQVEPGYGFYNMMSKILFFVIALLVLFLLYKIIWLILSVLIPIDEIFGVVSKKRYKGKG